MTQIPLLAYHKLLNKSLVLGKICLLSAFFLPTCGWTEPDEKPYFEEAVPEAETDYENVDAVHDASMSTLFNLTQDIDTFFGDVRGDEQRRNDWFRIGGETRFRAGNGSHFRERLRASLDLSAYAKNLRFFVSGESDSRNERARNIDSQLNEDDVQIDYQGEAATTGFGYDFYKSNQALISAGAGVKFSHGPRPFSDVRFSRWFPITDKLSFEPTQFFQWINGDGFGLRTRLDLNYQIGYQSRVRARTEVLRSQESRGVESFEDISYLFKFSERHYAGTAITGSYYDDPVWTAENYKLALRYRELIYKKFLYLEIEPALEFPYDRDYASTPSITFRIDMYLEEDAHEVSHH